MNIKPLGNRVVVEPMEQEELTASGIVIPDTAKEKPQRGKILAVGPGSRLEDGGRQELDVQVGDTVLFAKYGGTEVKIEGRTLLILREDDILAVIG